VLSPVSRAEQEQRRWIDKPNSLCFGLGNVTILTVAIDLPKVLTLVLSLGTCLLCYINVQFGEKVNVHFISHTIESSQGLYLIV
jgi:hypothetical protein